MGAESWENFGDGVGRRGGGVGVWYRRWGGFLWVDGEAKEEFGVGGGEEPIGSCGATAHLL